MKWVRFENRKRFCYGILEGDKVIATSQGLRSVLMGQEPQRRDEYALDEVRLLSPIARPRKIVCVGRNYAAHSREMGQEPPEKPILFTKFTTAVIGTQQTITWSGQLTQQVDYEGELAVIIGRAAVKVSLENAMNHIFGYTIGNDVTARDLQYGDGQWVRGKSLDTFCPLGPIMVTKDEIADPQDLRVRTFLNGEKMQDGYTGDMMFTCAYLVHYCSQAFTLEPGDIIMTGTPDGVGFKRNPPVFLKTDDEIVVEIDGIGRLENTCQML